jgi:hypothetical protein
MTWIHRRHGSRPKLAVTACSALVALVLAVVILFGSAGPAIATARPGEHTALTPPASLLAEFADGPIIRVRAKLVSLASVNAIDPGLAQCYSGTCKAGELVWLVLQDGPPYSFPHGTTSNYAFPPGFASWRLSLVDAKSGVQRGVSEIGDVGDLRTSPWGRLKGLAQP